MQLNKTQAYRCQVLYFEEDPGKRPLHEAVCFFPDALVLIEAGRIAGVGEYPLLAPEWEGVGIPIDERFRNNLMLPGFIDCHVHYPQTEMMGVYGASLLDWLETYTFATEMKFSDPEYAAEISDLFLRSLIASGTTTAMVFGTVHPQATRVFFEAAYRYQMRMIAGKVMMDRNAPSTLLDTPETSYQQSSELIKEWHGKGRLAYSVTPRFAPTSTPNQLQKAGQLLREFPGVYLHTHLSESSAEVDWVSELFPGAKNYLDVYDCFGLVGDHSVFAHGIYLSELELRRLHQCQSAVVFCPTSNLFLGSGLFPWYQACQTRHSIKLAMGTDVGAGTRFNLLETLNQAYKVSMLGRLQQPQQQPMNAFEGFYLATLGGARALSLDQVIGKIKSGYEADLVVLDWAPDDVQRLRQSIANDGDAWKTLEQKLFGMMMLGDDRNVVATCIQGNWHFAKSH